MSIGVHDESAAHIIVGAPLEDVAQQQRPAPSVPACRSRTPPRALASAAAITPSGIGIETRTVDAAAATTAASARGGSIAAGGSDFDEFDNIVSPQSSLTFVSRRASPRTSCRPARAARPPRRWPRRSRRRGRSEADAPVSARNRFCDRSTECGDGYKARRRRDEGPDHGTEDDEDLQVAIADDSRGDQPDQKDDQRIAEHELGDQVDGERTHHPVVERRDEPPPAGDDDDAREYECVGRSGGAAPLRPLRCWRRRGRGRGDR